MKLKPGFARALTITVAAALVVLALDGVVHVLMAQTPFGGPRPTAAEPQVGGIVGWLLSKQSEFFREMSATIRAAKSDGSAVWTLLAISFAYGIFHAAGPGHGKAVISSYLVANQETARRGIVLSFASALMQSLVAVVIVGICAWLPQPKPCAALKRRSRSQATA
jgi:nickel/cobalt exporter